MCKFTLFVPHLQITDVIVNFAGMNSNLNRTLARLNYKVNLAVRGHILNPLWADRYTRRKHRYDVTYRYVMDYLNRFYGDIRDFKPDMSEPSPEPERVFTIWLQGEENAPELVRACFNSMRRHLAMEVVVLDENTLFDWIQLPDYIVEKWRAGKIGAAHFADICRIELLYQHGGIWLDATDYVTAPVPEEIMEQDFFVYMAGKKLMGYYAKIQNCFIRSKKHNPLLAVWREAAFRYWQQEDSRIDYFFMQMLFVLCTQVNPIARERFERMPKIDQDPTHVLRSHLTERYNAERYKRYTAGTFFQKMNYKDKRLATALATPDTIAAHLLQ